MGCFRLVEGGVEIFVRLTPRSSKNAIEGIAVSDDGSSHLKARVRAVPEKGAANKALEKLIADWLGVPKSDVRVVAGTTARLKTVQVDGDGAALVEKLAGE